MNKTIVVSSCCNDCPLFTTDGGPGAVMICGHPIFKGYEGAIITHQNSSGRVPYECPLRYEEVVTTVKLDEKYD